MSKYAINKILENVKLWLIYKYNWYALIYKEELKIYRLFMPDWKKRDDKKMRMLKYLDLFVL